MPSILEYDTSLYRIWQARHAVSTPGHSRKAVALPLERQVLCARGVPPFLLWRVQNRHSHMDFPDDRPVPPRFSGALCWTPIKEKLPFCDSRCQNLMLFSCLFIPREGVSTLWVHIADLPWKYKVLFWERKNKSNTWGNGTSDGLL